MESFTLKPNFLGNILVRLVSFVVLVFLARFAYIFTLTCDSGDFCFLPETLHIAGNSHFPDSVTDHRSYYYAVFQDLIANGFLSTNSKSLCIETLTGQDIVAALIDIGVVDSMIGIFNKSSSPPLDDNSFDFEFAGNGVLDKSLKPVEFASEVSRTLKPGGFFVVHTMAKDNYSLHSLVQLFSSCKLIRSREIDSWQPSIRQVIFKKNKVGGFETTELVDVKRELIQKVEPLIEEEPLKPMKNNMRNAKYLSSMVDISFKNRYIYVDVGARSYTSSIGSWFNKMYPKQNKTFEIYAVESDREFHDEYRKKGVNLLPYAAWLRNETLFFEITREPSRKNVEKKGIGMGRVQSAQSSLNFVGDVDNNIKGFDFARWLMNLAQERDYLVVKMDVEGIEFHLIPRLIETGAICLIDEMFLECHYNRLQRCCPGKRSSKYDKTYKQCFELFSSLRDGGVLVHQWW